MYLNRLDGLDGRKKKRSRVDTALEAQAASVQDAFEKAEQPEATDEDIANANAMADSYNKTMDSYASREAKQKKTGLKKFVTAYEGTFKKVGKIAPGFKKHAQSVERRKRLGELKTESLRLQGQKPSAERDARLNAISGEMQALAAKEKKYLKQGKIVMLIVSIVVGIFTFGAGGVAVQGAFKALQAGAIEIAKKLLMAAALAAAGKGAKSSDVKKAKQAANDLETYPPDRNLPTFDAMIADSQTQKQIANEKTTSMLIPAGIVAALAFFG